MTQFKFDCQLKLSSKNFSHKVIKKEGVTDISIVFGLYCGDLYKQLLIWLPHNFSSIIINVLQGRK